MPTPTPMRRLKFRPLATAKQQVSNNTEKMEHRSRRLPLLRSNRYLAKEYVAPGVLLIWIGFGHVHRVQPMC